MYIQTLKSEDETGNAELDNAVEIAGYSYDPNQDIFYSNLDPWQRSVGYCRLYDEASAPLGMILDCEPIYFEYNEKKWMIGLWKGQYDLVTGAEIGVYKEALDLDIFGFFKGTFYSAVSNSELLQMSYTLNKNGKPLFTREGEHWWLTGFKLGEFSQPSELTLDINITFPDVIMRDAFVVGLKNTGYADEEFTKNGNTISLIFDTPYTPQVITRTAATDWIIQKKNQQLCLQYQKITGPYNNVQEKVKAIEELAPNLYEKIVRMGKSKQLYEYKTNLIVMILMALTVTVTGILLSSHLIANSDN